MLSTAANTGRLMQKSEIIAPSPCGGEPAPVLGRSSRRTLAPSRRRCRPCRTTGSPASSPSSTSTAPAVRWPSRTGSAPGAAVLDDEHEGAVALGDHRLFRDQHRRPLLQHDLDVHEHAGRQDQVGIGEDGAHPKGARHLADPGVDGGDTATEGPPGKSRARGAHRLPLAHPAEEDLGHAELDLDLGQIVERGQHGLVVDAGADVDPPDADHAGERRLHSTVGELLPRTIEPRAGRRRNAA